MKKWVANILEAVGKTPLVRLRKISPQQGGRLFAKMEAVNPGGSVKTRTALGMIEAAERNGLLRPDSVILEVSSGNQGIALAMIGAVKGYKVKIIMPESMSAERRSLIEAYGAEIILCPSGNTIQETFEAAQKLAGRMAGEDAKIFRPSQFDNPANPEIHRQTTAREILQQLDRPIDAFIAGYGTGGTLTGVGGVLKQCYPAVRIIAVEPENAAALTGGTIGNHIQQGIGDGFVPENLDRTLIDAVIRISDEEAAAMTRRLAREEGLLCGVSSGANVAAALSVAKSMPAGSTAVTILPDTGERYLSTGLFH